MNRPVPGGARPAPGRRARAGVGRFVRRRLGEVALVVTWVVVVFNSIQVAGGDRESGARTALSYAALLAIGVAATVLWVRSRRR